MYCTRGRTKRKNGIQLYYLCYYVSPVLYGHSLLLIGFANILTMININVCSSHKRARNRLFFLLSFSFHFFFVFAYGPSVFILQLVNQMFSVFTLVASPLGPKALAAASSSECLPPCLSYQVRILVLR